MSLRTRLARWLLGPVPQLVDPASPYQLERMLDLARIAAAEGRSSAPIPTEWTLAALLELAKVRANDHARAVLALLDAERAKPMVLAGADFGRDEGTARVLFATPPRHGKAEAHRYLENVVMLPPELRAEDVHPAPQPFKVGEIVEERDATVLVHEATGQRAPRQAEVKGWLGEPTAPRDLLVRWLNNGTLETRPTREFVRLPFRDLAGQWAALPERLFVSLITGKPWNATTTNNGVPEK